MGLDLEFHEASPLTNATAYVVVSDLDHSPDGFPCLVEDCVNMVELGGATTSGRSHRQDPRRSEATVPESRDLKLGQRPFVPGLKARESPAERPQGMWLS